jgi:hypothetical protein
LQAAFNRAKEISNPLSTGAVLCGQKQMTEVRYYCDHLLLFVCTIMTDVIIAIIFIVCLRCVIIDSFGEWPLSFLTVMAVFRKLNLLGLTILNKKKISAQILTVSSSGN